CYGLSQLDWRAERNRPAQAVGGIALAPSGEIMIALAPLHDAFAISDYAQLGFERHQVMRLRGRQHGLAEGYAIEPVITRNEHFGLARAADPRVSLVRMAHECMGNRDNAA